MKVQLTEGKFFPFKITGDAVLPDETECFILTDPNEVHHLLEKSSYVNYHFKQGQVIQCRIDKINCAGKVFIEPEHPFYQPGNSYKFPLIRVKEEKGNRESMAVFSDVFQNEIEIPVEELAGHPIPGNSYELKVVKIKKGQVLLSTGKNEQDFDAFVPGKFYSFKIVHLTNYPGRFNFYLLVSEQGKTYKVRSKYYEDYKFEIGQTVNCRMIDYESDRFLEPENPFYQPGKTYEFEILHHSFISEYPGAEKEVYILNNKSGKEIYFPVEDVSANKIADGKIKCKITDIRKGKLILGCR